MLLPRIASSSLIVLLAVLPQGCQRADAVPPIAASAVAPSFTIPDAHPRILLADEATKARLKKLLATRSPAAIRFEEQVTGQLMGRNAYAFQPWYAALMLQLTGQERYADYAILYRGNHQARPFEQALRAQGVPYEISGGQSYFERVEIKDLVAYLRLIANDADDPAFIRAVTTPKRGVGTTTLERLGAIGGARHESLFAAVYADEARTSIPARQREILDAFCALINDLRFRADREPASRLLDELVAAIGYDDYLDSTCDKKQAEARSRSVRDFIGWLSKKGEADRKNLLELTQMIALITMLEGQEQAQPDAVRLSTLHAAKGLEFPHVFVVGLEEGLLPHRESVANGNVEEERRLFYVGITRAERSLHLSFCRKRRRAGETIECQPSRFLAELAKEDLRWSGEPLPPDEAAKEKSTGSERLKAMKAMLAAKGASCGAAAPAGASGAATIDDSGMPSDAVDDSGMPADNQSAPI